MNNGITTILIWMIAFKLFPGMFEALGTGFLWIVGIVAAVWLLRGLWRVIKAIPGTIAGNLKHEAEQLSKPHVKVSMYQDKSLLGGEHADIYQSIMKGEK